MWLGPSVEDWGGGTGHSSPKDEGPDPFASVGGGRRSTSTPVPLGGADVGGVTTPLSWRPRATGEEGETGESKEGKRNATPPLRDTTGPTRHPPLGGGRSDDTRPEAQGQEKGFEGGKGGGERACPPPRLRVSPNGERVPVGRPDPVSSKDQSRCLGPWVDPSSRNPRRRGRRQIGTRTQRSRGLDPPKE